MTLSVDSVHKMNATFASLCEAAGKAAAVTSIAGTQGKPDFWPEGQSDSVLSDMKRWWPGSLIQFTDESFGFTPVDGEVARRAEGAVSIKYFAAVGGAGRYLKRSERHSVKAVWLGCLKDTEDEQRADAAPRVGSMTARLKAVAAPLSSADGFGVQLSVGMCEALM